MTPATISALTVASLIGHVLASYCMAIRSAAGPLRNHAAWLAPVALGVSVGATFILVKAQADDVRVALLVVALQVLCAVLLAAAIDSVPAD